MKRSNVWAWVIVIGGALYFLLPVLGTLEFSLRAKKGELSLLAYENIFNDPRFFETFGFSVRMAIFTILLSLILIVPTAYWVHLKLPRLRPVIEMISLLPFVIPAVVLIFGLIRTYSRPPLALTDNTFTTDLLLIGGYIVLTFPYMYRAVDIGLRSLDVRGLTEAAQSLGASWPSILARVIFPNLRMAVISGALITFATVVGELILASFLARPAFGVYMVSIGMNKAYEPAALAIISYALTWASLGLIQFTSSRGAPNQALGGAR
jgi:putative spermidine/putrescine transport system permease protein